ncbi:haloacid dehalogenase-like hydrolase domain-containing protein 2 [Trichogramma pretiosum]|uniref:haloacid dehalogenase-like hydrolase domain-containing protein 2 n=1 Tax=Trichogramma pretiosum TaxID=7493 RepID=UPI0006C97CF1|nr:haloacid dehalogenase-like hydrolase domain-containing protein 2 [Trichogramma pretiosum]
MAQKIKLVLIDLSGTLHIDNSVIPGAIEALKKLRGLNAQVKFVTNTTKESKNILHTRLQTLGFDIKKDEIFSSLGAARELVKSRKLNPLLLIDDAALEDFTDIIDEKQPSNAVLVGLAPEKFNYKYLNEAFRLLLEGAPLIAIHKGRYYKKSDGLALGPGAFVQGLEFSANVKAEIIGKPSANFFKKALGNFSPEEAVMIGDDVNDDVAGAQAAGIKGFLVKTGKYRVGDENTIDPVPAKVCNSFVDAVDMILQNNDS